MRDPHCEALTVRHGGGGGAGEETKFYTHSTQEFRENVLKPNKRKSQGSIDNKKTKLFTILDVDLV